MITDDSILDRLLECEDTVAELRRLLADTVAHLLNRGEKSCRGLDPKELKMLATILRPVSFVSIEMRPDGTSLVTIEEIVIKRLSAKLTVLLLAISSTKPGEDGLPAYRSRDSLAALVEVNQHALAQLLYRFKHEVLLAQGLNPLLVDCQAGGVRFLTRKFSARIDSKQHADSVVGDRKDGTTIVEAKQA